MQKQDVSFAGVLVNTSHTSRGTTTNTMPSISGRSIVESSPVLPGNRHTPMAWSFRVFKQKGPYGTWTGKEAERFVNGVPVWATYVSQGDLWLSLDGQVPQPGSSLVSRVYNKALTKLYDQIRDSDVNLATSIGESHETVKMIKAVIDGAIQAKKNLRKLLKNNGIAGASRKLSSAWLGYAYGVRPLVSDVQAMLNHISSNPSVLDVSTRARASASVTVDSILDDFSTGRPNVVRQSVRDSRRCQVGVTWTPSDYKLNELSRITSTFPPTLMWELTTLSFVIDWFVDVGSYLANLEASFGLGLTFKYGYVTQSRHIQLSRDCSWSQEPAPSGHRTTTQSIWTCDVSEKASDRVLLSGFPRPMLPTLTVPLGSEQLLSLAALLRTIGLKKY